VLATEIFGVPSPGAPQMMAETMISSTVAETKTTTSTIGNNAAKGAQFEETVGVQLSQEGHSGLGAQVTIKADNGVRTRLDFISNDKNGNVALTEAKSSSTARLTKNQKLAYPSIAENGGVVMGQGKPGFPGGTRIPPTQVNIIRPKFSIQNID
jgi:hypothetical protein